MSGKGDNPRPLSVTPEQFAANFDAIDWNAREREAKAAPYGYLYGLPLRPVRASEVVGDPVSDEELATWFTTAPEPAP